ncbi:MAG: phosphoribosylformylglycinamidine synthase subunit PurL [Flavobacteriales bacterium]|nr:phosphoribosylformylglycinamidine synthase subunit PurL [Flavobacteriales bacterium]
MSQPSTTVETAKKLGLLAEEYEQIKQILGRTPNFTELCAYSGMWSEHCSYKNSILWLKTLPKDGPHMLAKAGEENAGLVDIGDGLACCFKIESHNHPSAIEPYQGAATGVGGINRDIFTMGARPIAQLNSLRFGNIDTDRTKWIMQGVVKGIGSYGNSFGVPTVGGEVFFDDSFEQNPLVNAMSAGIVKIGQTISATSYGVGNPVYIVGSATGKDGIGGAAFASGDLTEDSKKDLPAVQVGDPFQEKLLLEATLEVVASRAVIGMQDMGAAGIICSTAEMSAKGEHGMRIDLDKVPTRQADMLPYELLLSESQERMLVVVKKGQEKVIEDIFEKWDLPCANIGEVIEGGQLEFYFHGEKVADLPAESLVLGGGAPQYERDYSEPAYYAESKKFNPDTIPQPTNYKDVATYLISHPNIASKNWVYNQYDSMVGTVNMNTNNPCDAAIVNIKENNKAIALTVDCNSRYVQADPEIGTEIAVSEAARNIICSGGKPSAITNCLNFGNPYNHEAYWQFVGAIKGMSKACRHFQTPVTGGNVSFYNQSKIGDKVIPVFPTPSIGMLGLLDKKEWQTGIGFKSPNHVIYLIGTHGTGDINASEYLYSFKNIKNTPAPYFNIDEESAMHNLIKDLIRNKSIESAHDISDGGLITTLLESAFVNNLGFEIEKSIDERKDAFLFGEAQGRVVISLNADQQPIFESLIVKHTVPVLYLGKVTKGQIEVDGEHWGDVSEFKQKYTDSIAARLY